MTSPPATTSAWSASAKLSASLEQGGAPIGAGKTTLLHMLAGQLRPAAGSVLGTAGVGHLPQDSRVADQSVTVTDRFLSARGPDRAVRALRSAEAAMADGTDRSMNACVRA